MSAGVPQVGRIRRPNSSPTRWSPRAGAVRLSHQAEPGRGGRGDGVLAERDRQLCASLQTLFGGNISILTNLCEHARAEAFDLMVEHAAEMGANAIINMRYDATEIMQVRHRSAGLWHGSDCGARMMATVEPTYTSPWMCDPAGPGHEQVQEHALPRLVPGAPLPPYSYVTGRFPHPTSDPRGHSYGHAPTAGRRSTRSSGAPGATICSAAICSTTATTGKRHETWEAVWKACGRRGTPADFLKGLIKLAAAGVKSRARAGPKELPGTGRRIAISPGAGRSSSPARTRASTWTC